MGFLVDCQWGSWEAWSSCGTACAAANGTGDQIRTRTSTAATNGGTCNAADGSETQSCSTECPGNKISRCFCKLVTELCFFQCIVNGVAGKLGQAVEQIVVQLMVPEIKPEQDLVQVGQMVELYVMRLMEVTPSPAVLNAQVIELCGFVTW